MNPAAREPNRAEAVKFAVAVSVQNEIDRDQEWGDRLHCTVEVYRQLLLRRIQKKPTSAIQFQLMKDSIEEIDEIFAQLHVAEAGSLKGWAYGMPSGDNLAWGLSTFLITMRNDMLVTIGAIMHSPRH